MVTSLLFYFELTYEINDDLIIIM